MNVRVIAGQFGGRIIDAPGRSTTHAMSERVRNALFNSLSSEVMDAEVLDAFAGSGAIGLEAISRGAGHATFIEKDRIAHKIITNNIDKLGCSDQTTAIHASVGSWLDTTTSKGFDIIFADPPYQDTQFSTVHRLLGMLKPGGLMVLSHPGRGELPTKTGVVVVDNRSYGNAVLTFYRRED